MSVAAALGSRAKTFVFSTFTELSIWKRWLVRLAVIGLVAGGAMYVIALTKGDEAGGFSNAGMRSGGGYLLGFLAGAFVRLFLKVSLLIAIVAAAGAWGLCQLGWVELPYHSLADVQAAFSVKAQSSAAWLDAFFKSHLPHSAATALGGFCGVTQRPRASPAKPG